MSLQGGSFVYIIRCIIDIIVEIYVPNVILMNPAPIQCVRWGPIVEASAIDQGRRFPPINR